MCSERYFNLCPSGPNETLSRERFVARTFASNSAASTFLNGFAAEAKMLALGGVLLLLLNAPICASISPMMLVS